MKNKVKRNGKQQNNQASDKGKKIFLDEQYVKAAAQMERELFADKDFEDYEPEDSEAEARSYENLVDRLKREGVYREEYADMAEASGIEAANEEEFPETGKTVAVEGGLKTGKVAVAEEGLKTGKAACAEDVLETGKFADIKVSQDPSSGRRKYGRVHVGKVAGVALLCCTCIFAASMTSQANRNYLINNIRVWSGNDTKTVVDNSEQNEKVDTAEYEAVEEIEKQLGVEMPEFYYRPNGFEFVSYEIDTTVDIARIEYQYKDNIISYIVDKQNMDAASKIISADSTQKFDVIQGAEVQKIFIEKIQGDQDRKPSYSAHWEINGTLYYLSGKIEEQELKKILEQMKF